MRVAYTAADASVFSQATNSSAMRPASSDRLSIPMRASGGMAARPPAIAGTASPIIGTPSAMPGTASAIAGAGSDMKSAAGGSSSCGVARSGTSNPSGGGGGVLNGS